MEQEQQQDISPTPVETEDQDAGIEPTKSVKTFWERLDEVFAMNLEAQKMRQKVETLLEEFPSESKGQDIYRSFLFQPERIVLSSNDSIDQSVQVSNVSFADGGHQSSETFSSFRIRFQRALVNVKSIQLLSATIPNAIQNLPDNQVIFFYYKLRSVALANQGAWSGVTNYLAGDIVTYNTNTFVALRANVASLPAPPNLGNSWSQITLPANTASPNYYDLNINHLNYMYLPPTFGAPPEEAPAAQRAAYNRTFQDYNDLVVALNTASTYYSSIPDDVSFVFDQTLNKIQFVPNAADLAAGYYFVPAGYEDPNLEVKADELLLVFPGIFTPGYTLNLRLGYTWNGLFPNPFSFSNIWIQNQFANIMYYAMRPYDPNYAAGLAWNSNLITFNSYPDLVHTSCVRVYCDVSLGSTEDSNGQQGLLSVVPVNTTNLGVGFYQNNFNNPLTKIPKILPEISIRLVTDQGLPFLLPNSATILLELGMTYH